MEQRSNAAIFPNRVALDKIYIEEKGGILNALTYASAQYIYKVLEKYGREKIKRFDEFKTKKLRRTIIHKNAHLDEYFAELIFRAILPPHLKDIEVSEHVLMSKEDDTFAKISWPNGVVFGIHAEETGGAKALAFFDEHLPDGTRIKPSCSQLVADEFLGSKIPRSIKKVLDEVNYTDSHKGAHQYNIKNLFFAMHDILFIIGKNEIDNTPVTKYLTENWKRAIVDSCMTAMIYAYENDLISDSLSSEEKEKLERTTKRSLNYFLDHTILKEIKAEQFNMENKEKNVAKDLSRNFKVWDVSAKSREKKEKFWHQTIDNAVFKDKKTGEITGRQILIIHQVCFALHKCWGENIANFIMMHIWQILFQDQICFQEIEKDIRSHLVENEEVKTCFGSFYKSSISDIGFKPVQKETDDRDRELNKISKLWIYEINVTNPNYPNVKKVVGSILNKKNNEEGNDGFGVFILHDKIINSKAINNGPTVPSQVWSNLSNRIKQVEPDRWFQLKDEEGDDADFILNRTKAHQDLLPTNLIDAEFIKETILNL